MKEFFQFNPSCLIYQYIVVHSILSYFCKVLLMMLFHSILEICVCFYFCWLSQLKFFNFFLIFKELLCEKYSVLIFYSLFHLCFVYAIIISFLFSAFFVFHLLFFFFTVDLGYWFKMFIFLIWAFIALHFLLNIANSAKYFPWILNLLMPLSSLFFFFFY